jgi:gamma-glutamylcysteine synthetase
VRDVEFIHLFFLWCAAQERETLTAERQRESVAAFKAAARLAHRLQPWIAHPRYDRDHH